MTAVDTNLLFAWLAQDHTNHASAHRWFSGHLEARQLVVCGLCLIELFVLLRNPVLLRKPLSAPQAVERIQTLHLNPIWIQIDCLEGCMEEAWSIASEHAEARRRIFDIRLAVTLRRQGVEELATANTRDFIGFGFRWVWNPLPTS